MSHGVYSCAISNEFVTFNFMSETPKIFTLKQVVSSIRKTIEERYQQMYWVKAEMHKLNRYPSGHCFPELLQKEEGKIVAQITGSIWKHNFERINERFIQVVKEPLKEDTTLLMQVKISFHEMYGLSLQIMDIDPNYALGELQRERMETLKRLKKDGLINRNQELKFPLLPKRIAIVSAESSKGLSDFMQVIEKNDWNYQFFTMLFPAYLQGDLAASSIITQLDRIERVKHHFDLVVIVRGGGGEVGLSCYNNYELCKHIASFPLPVLTGIGHSTNMTVAEMIAYRNAITPTELGDFLIQAFHNFSVPLKDAVNSIQIHAKMLLSDSKNELKTTSRSFKELTGQAIVRERYALSEMQQKMQSSLRYNFERSKELLYRREQQIGTKSKSLLNQHANRLHRFQDQLPYFSKSIFTKNNNQLDRLAQSVKLMDPINVLNRGYSITTIDGKTVSLENPVKKGSRIQTRTANFIIESDVTSSEEESNEREDELHRSV